MERNGGKKNPGKRGVQAGQKSGAQHKTGLVGERKLQPYGPHGVERTNCIGFIFPSLRCESVLPLIFSLGEEATMRWPIASIHRNLLMDEA